MQVGVQEPVIRAGLQEPFELVVFAGAGELASPAVRFGAVGEAAEPLWVDVLVDDSAEPAECADNAHRVRGGLAQSRAGTNALQQHCQSVVPGGVHLRRGARA